nr:MAG TPA_asm: hypothetical protein [Caudoviricetes sp.]
MWGNNGGKLFQFKPTTIDFMRYNAYVKKFFEKYFIFFAFSLDIL